MTSEGPDPLAFKSWEDAFQYPVPTIRKLEQQLRNHADENRNKLRTLVGVSYRDLLGTAERIIEMDTQMQEVEVILGQTGQKCNSRAVDRVFKNYGQFKKALDARASERNTLASQLALLQTCPTIITRLLKRGASSLLAAKILVLSRLTHKTLSQHPDPPPLVDLLRGRLASLRRKLLNAIDKRLSSPDKDVKNIVEDMCAFSLATSSTPTDVLRHFHHVRLEAIKWHLEEETNVKEHVLKAVNLLLKTLHDSQLIFPKRLSDALAKLKDQPLIQQADVTSVSELNFDLHRRWLADELRNYTPWPRHDELQKLEADKQLKAWAKQALKSFFAGLKRVLAGQSNFNEVITMRRDLLEAWPWSESRLPGLHSADVVDELRNILNAQLGEIILHHVEDLQRVLASISKALAAESLHDPASDSLWDSSVISMDFGNGAAGFKRVILARYHGGGDAIAEVMAYYEKWATGVFSIQSLLKEMRESRWDDDITEDADDLDSRQALLSEDDPRTLDETLKTSLKDSSERLHSAFLDIVRTSLADKAGVPQRAIFLLRILREISRRSIAHEKSIASVTSLTTSSPKITIPLQSALAASVMVSALAVYQSSLMKIVRASSLPARALWEGNPPLPVQPSAAAFRFLRKLTNDMAALGADLWSPGAVNAVKSVVAGQLTSDIKEAASRISSGNETLKDHTEGDEATNGSSPGDDLDGSKYPNLQQEKLLQMLLDTSYLQKSLSEPHNEHDGLGTVLEELRTHAEVDDVESNRIKKSAAEYWKRTYLLFALLVPDG